VGATKGTKRAFAVSLAFGALAAASVAVVGLVAGCRETSVAPGTCGGTKVEVGCPCPTGLDSVGGGCASRAIGAALCGARPESQLACARVTCPKGDAFDPSRGLCVAPRELSEMPEIAWLGLHEGEHLVCPGEGELELSNGHAGCRPSSTCRFREAWDGVHCVSEPPCPVGSFRPLRKKPIALDAGTEGGRGAAAFGSDAGSKKPDASVVDAGATPLPIEACVSFMQGRTVDLAAWAHAVLERDLCPVLPVMPNAETFRIDLDVPGNDLAQLSTTVENTTASHGLGSAEVLARRAVEADVEGLRSLQLEASTPHVVLTVTCPGHTFGSPKVENERDGGS
jgi:hypothetical protein